MSRTVRVAAAQMGTTNVWDARPDTLNRMIALLNNAADGGAQLVVFPETAFTTFFPRYIILDENELETWFEHGDIRTAPNTKALFDTAQSRSVDIVVGFAETTDAGDHYNTCIYYHAATGSILSKYRKIHLPGDKEPFPDPEAVNQLEKRYFLPGNLGWQAFRVPGLVDPAGQSDPIMGMMICNDRRWAESWRVLGLQGVEIVLVGYNTTSFAPSLWGVAADIDPKEAEEISLFQHKLVMQCYSYTNSCFSVSAARAGLDDGKYPLIGGSTIIDPEGRLLAESKTTEDEVIIADCDLLLCRPGKTRTFDFARHRRVEHYGRIVQQTGVIEPPQETAVGPCVETHAAQRPFGRYRILLINPNSSKFMTDNCVASVQPTLPPDVDVVGFTAPEPAPTAVEGHSDGILSAAATLRALLPITENYDAFVIACYSDHPLIYALREEVRAPAMGIMEASLFAARTVGTRFGVVATSARSETMHADAVRRYGLDAFCAGIKSSGLSVLELDSADEKVVEEAMCRTATELVQRGADTITLGCAGMTNLKEAVQAAVGEDVPVIDGVVAGVHNVVGILRSGLCTAKRGGYSSAKAQRVVRGQDFL
ncbi:carbon-nitrogen hydrolase [Aspergillus candidus]|uniref:Carbon-nitrogen hydrolase n=1 Tax=Aspergillus candidus TaxID=41067 RepID=A0A2I2FH28_ASPCN|nr:carbon-nitrogen hydrolase [Aspergillus candidus]PLB39909.1 carbon-nitrogen hydrolase [Aspergillus candidus]